MPKPLDKWPLILCGPMLRRVEPTSVSVFVALKHPRKVKLSVFPPGTSTTVRGDREAMTHEIGRYLHACLVTVKFEDSKKLEPGKNYRYDITLTPTGTPDELDKDPSVKTLGSSKMLEGDRPLGYQKDELPTFALPPNDLGDLRLVHASCRKPHGERRDVFLALDTIIKDTRSDPDRRPHQLFLTGDQIYADDVAEPLLAELTPTGEMLLGWTTPDGKPAPELLPGLTGTPKPGERAALLKDPPFGSDEKDSHLMTLGEFFAMYLFAWSDALWPETLPTFDKLPAAEQKRYGEKKRRHYDDRVKSLVGAHSATENVFGFRSAIGNVRRALANVPTYMIFDDHEITDDWFLTSGIKTATVNSELATRIVVNGLSAYAVFQAWGNTPEQFESGEIGTTLLDYLKDWRGQNDSNFVGISSAVQVPQTQGKGLRWDYELLCPAHQVIVLNTRTERAYPPKDARGAPDLLSPTALKNQVTARQPTTERPAKPVTVLVSPAPVFGHPLHEWVAHELGKAGFETFGDREPWLNPKRRRVFEDLLEALVPFRSVLILSGDVHYGLSARVRYWDERTFAKRRASFVQFISSALKNEDFKTRELSILPYLKPTGYLGWDTAGPHLGVGSSDIHARGSEDGKPPYMYKSKAHGPKESVSNPPQWRYSVEFLTDERSASERGVPDPRPVKIPLPVTSSPIDHIWVGTRLALEHQRILKNASMRSVVGVNNLAVVRFSTSEPGVNPPQIYVHQRSWFRLKQGDEPKPYTIHAAFLTVPEAADPKPTATAIEGAPPELGAWADLISFRPPQAVQWSLKKRGPSGEDWPIHRIEDAHGEINLDYYPVRVTTMPEIQGVVVGSEDLLDLVRRLLIVKDSVLDGAVCEFSPYGASDGTLWSSSAPLGAVMHIDMKVFDPDPNLENGSVVCSSYRPEQWIFSTLWTNNDFGHPVSGNRAFGFVTNDDGSHTFYTRGADRTTAWVDDAMHVMVFAKADQLWKSFQTKLASFVNDNSGVATVEASTSKRYNWIDVSSRYWSPAEDWIR